MDEINRKEIANRLKALKEQYKYKEPDIFTEDSTYSISTYVIDNYLDNIDKTLIYLYAEAGSLRKLGDMIGCSHQSVRNEINRIKTNIKNKINEIKELW